MRLLLAAVLLAAATVPLSEGFAVVGYVPDYRMDTMDWERAVTLTTHLVLFSMEPRADAGLDGVGRIKAVLQQGSPLRSALARVENPAKILVTLGGAGRSQHFAKISSSKKARKKLANTVVQLFEDLPILAGLDLDWEVPAKEPQWRDFGKLAQELRSSWAESETLSQREGALLLTMAFHPGTGAVSNFANVRAKKSEKAFVDLFDFCHAMAYTHFDHERRHSTDAMDKQTLEEWKKYELPPGKLTLGMPLFGVARKTGETLSYADIIAREPTLERQTQVDESQAGVYFVNADSLARKVQLAGRQGLAGVMLWELGQDRRAPASGLLRHVAAAAEGVRASWSYRLSWLPFGENHVIMVLSALAGLYLLKEVLIGSPPGHKLAARRPPRAEGPPADGAAADGAAAAAPAAAAAEGAAGDAGASG